MALETADEVKAVSAELAKNKKTNLFRCLWAMQFESTLRFGDTVKLTWDQFAEGKTHLTIKQEKRGNFTKSLLPRLCALSSKLAGKKQQTAQNSVTTYSACPT